MRLELRLVESHHLRLVDPPLVVQGCAARNGQGASRVRFFSTTRYKADTNG